MAIISQSDVCNISNWVTQHEKWTLTKAYFIDDIFIFCLISIGAMGRRSARTSVVTADVEFDPSICGDSGGNVVQEPDTLELVDTVESSV